MLKALLPLLLWISTGSTAPAGVATYLRSNGIVAFHKLYHLKMNFPRAKKHCEQNGAHLAGITSREEAQKLIDLANEAGESNEQYWLGGQRKGECYGMRNYDKDHGLNATCSLSNVVQWLDNVAETIDPDWWKIPGPSHIPFNMPQQCLSFVHGDRDWTTPNDPGFLDDIGCDVPRKFFCTELHEWLRYGN